MSRRLLVGLLGLLGLGACSAIVGGPIDPSRPIACDPWAGDPCPPPYSCIDGICTVTFDVCNGVDDDLDTRTDEGSSVAPPCEDDTRCVSGRCLSGCSNEVCNGRDDDCDEGIDEALDVDTDGDGVSACPPTGTADCDDTNPRVHPANPATGVVAAQEICNGIDDDCSGATTEDVVGICPGGVCQRLPGAVAPECFAPDDCRIAACTAPRICDGATNRCSAPPTDCRMIGMTCPSPLVCDASDGSCDEPPLGAIGAACLQDGQCESGLCFPRAALGLTGSGGICGRSCCDQTDCGPGQRCWTPRSGARSCVTAEVYGDLDAFACGSPGACPDEGCLARTVTVTTPSGTTSFDGMFCDGSPLLGDDAFCSDTFLGRVPCNHGFCMTDVEGGVCAAPCERTEDCRTYYPPWFRTTYYPPVCSYVSTGTSLITACIPPPASGAGPGTTGSICSGNAECRDGLCVNGRCADVCCSDDNCPGEYRCAPINGTLGSERDVWVMRCFPRATAPM